jgi:hypothetical protein
MNIGIQAAARGERILFVVEACHPVLLPQGPSVGSLTLSLQSI